MKTMVMLGVDNIFLSSSPLIRYSRDIPKDAYKINGLERSRHRNIFVLLSVDYTIYYMGQPQRRQKTQWSCRMFMVASLSSNPLNKYSIKGTVV